MGKKIVGLISFMNAAGAQEALLRLMRQLRLRGHETEVWFLYAKSSCYRGQPGVRVILDKPHLSPLDMPVLFFRLLKLLGRTRPDVVVGFLPLANVMGMIAAFMAGVPLRIASHRAPEPTFGRVMQLIDRQLGSRGVYDKIICVSRSVKESFSGYADSYQARLSVVNNGIEWTPSTKDKASARASFDLPETFPLLVATGRFVPQKNYDLMMRVIATTPRLRLAVAGDGPLRPAAEALVRDMGAEDRVHFLGSLPHERVIDLLRAADGFVQTSFYEGQSNSVLEAMHEGLAIICSDIPTQRESVCDENGDPAAFLVPLGEFEAWRSAFLGLRDHLALAQETGARAKALVSRLFTLSGMIDGFEEAILETEKQVWVPSGTKHVVERADSTP